MRTGCIIGEALRSIICVVLAYVIFFQAFAGAVSGGAMAAQKALGLDKLSMICSSDGPKRSVPDGGPQLPHGSGNDCCAWACAEKLTDTPEPVATPFREIGFYFTNLSILPSGHRDIHALHPGPPRVQAARAPPLLQS